MKVPLRVPPMILMVLLLTGCQPKSTGLFSTLDIDKDGLMYGYEIFIVRGDRATGPESDYYAIVQCADGRLSPPLIGQVETVGDQVSITLPSDVELGCPSTQFIGRVEFKELVGKFGNDKELRLPRKDSFWE